MSNLRSLKRPAPPAHAPRVLDESFQIRIAALTKVERKLREMGHRVVWTKLAGPKPQAHILRDSAISIAPLFDKMGPRSFAKRDGCVIVAGDLDGVIVSWTEPTQ